MAFIYSAQLVPSKLELISGWAPSQPWWIAGAAPVEIAGAYRFDDPADEVGIETHLLRAGEGQAARTVQVPLTYRGAPLGGAEPGLIATMQHSVLGQRWVYDACFDPVYVTALATAIVTGASQAELQFMSDGRLQTREPTTRVVGNGTPGATVPRIDAVTSTTDQASTTIRTAELELVVRRVLDGEAITGSALTLSGVWPGRDEPVVLALARPATGDGWGVE
jgi:hypothetical protein